MTSVHSHTPRRAAVTAHTLVQHLIADAAMTWPEAVAVQCGDAALHYAELDADSNRLARRLRALGVAPEQRVVILVDRSVEMIVALLAVLKAGCAYVPLDAANPPERLAFLLADAAPAAIIITEAQRPLLPERPPTVVSLERDRDAIARESTDPLPDLVGPDALAYMIYTSGSTGQPKGVQIEQRSVLAFLDGLAPHLAFGPGDVHGAVASLSFDMSALDIYATLTAGACLLLVPRELVAHPQALRAYLAAHDATSLQATPTAWRMLLEAGWSPEPGFRALSGGEALSQVLADKLTVMGLDVWNLYGPTEVTIYAYVAHLAAGDRVTLGHPLATATGYVLDERGAPVARGADGLLFLGGPQVARGYWQRAELTAERFVADRFAGWPGARLYNTGDIVHARADGALEYVGRRDDQVKVRGYRIELAEVEAAFLEQPGVVSAAVVVHRAPTGEDPRLIAYVTVGKGVRRSTDRNAVYVPVATLLRYAVAEALPSHMVPERVVVLNAMPVTVAGKIDRVGLAAMPRQLTIPEFVRAGSLVEPRTDIERRLAEIFERVLDMRPIGVTDNFFDLGATSVAATRLFTEIEQQIGPHLPLAPLFTAPTIEQLAALIEENATEARSMQRSTSLVAIQPRGSRPPIVCVHGGVGTILHFRPLARYLGDDQPFYGLQMQGLEGDLPLHTSIEAMAHHYVNEMLAHHVRGPYVVAGYCFGAIVAQEMARMLTARGQRVTLLVSLNGASAGFIRRKRREAAIPLWRRAGLRRAWDQLQQRIEFLRIRRASALGHAFDEAARRHVIPTITHHLEQTYVAKPWKGPMLVAQSETMFRERDIGWREIKGIDVQTHVSATWVDDKRQILMEPAVVWLADTVRMAIDRAMRRP
jgi:amino acid adenylation domain-containing protein